MARKVVRVAGVCKAGHALERDAEPDDYGRPKLTWRGECPEPGCTLHVLARRVKGTTSKTSTTAAAPVATPPPATPAAPPRRTVRKVTAYRDAPTRPARPRSGAPAADREPSSVSTAPLPTVAKPRVVDKPDPGNGVDEPGPGRRPRRRFSLGRRDIRERDGYVIPGIY